VTVVGADAGLHVVVWLNRVPRSREHALGARAATLACTRSLRVGARSGGRSPEPRARCSATRPVCPPGVED
jgi:hypothetical protein